jgi:hypothetical protein
LFDVLWCHSGAVQATYNGTHAGAYNYVDRNAFVVEHFEHTKAGCRPQAVTPESQGDAWSFQSDLTHPYAYAGFDLACSSGSGHLTLSLRTEIACWR